MASCQQVVPCWLGIVPLSRSAASAEECERERKRKRISSECVCVCTTEAGEALSVQYVRCIDVFVVCRRAPPKCWCAVRAVEDGALDGSEGSNVAARSLRILMLCANWRRLLAKTLRK
jgi:hypothetical protein